MRDKDNYIMAIVSFLFGALIGFIILECFVNLSIWLITDYWYTLREMYIQPGFYRFAAWAITIGSGLGLAKEAI